MNELERAAFVTILDWMDVQLKEVRGCVTQLPIRITPASDGDPYWELEKVTMTANGFLRACGKIEDEVCENCQGEDM